MSLISSISIPTTLELSLPKPHTIYQIVTKRYSQFTELDAQIIQTTGRHPPQSLPAKSYLRSPNIEERRAALEVYLRALIGDKTLGSGAALKQFLEVPLPKASRAVHRDFYDLVRDIRSDLQLARRHLQTQSAESFVQIKKTLHSADRSFAELTTLEKDAKVSEAEQRRRKDVCDELHRESLALMTLAQNYRHSSKSSTQHSAARESSSDSPFMPRSAAITGGGRQLGKAAAPQETEATLGKTNDELLHGQTQLISQQDDLLASLLPVLQRQRELGNIIGQELDEQSKMLDELGDGMDKMEGKLKRGAKQITKITGKK